MRITYTTPKAQKSDLIIEAETKIKARFLFTELYPEMKFKKASKTKTK